MFLIPYKKSFSVPDPEEPDERDEEGRDVGPPEYACAGCPARFGRNSRREGWR